MPGSPYTDLQRPPLNAPALRRALLVPGALWTRLDLRAETDSTNADAAEAARAGEPEGLVVVAEWQRAGRGRQGRAWTSPARAGIACSVLLRPGAAVPGRRWDPAPVSAYGWLPLLTGVALLEAVRRVADVDTALKWPNDLLVRGAGGNGGPVGPGAPGGYGKCAGILAESVPGVAGAAMAVVLGVGLNVTVRADELPTGVGGLPGTSLALAGAPAADRGPLLRALLRALETWYDRWRRCGGDPDASGLRQAYLAGCVTIGTQVRIHLPAGQELAGTATGVDRDGQLLVRTTMGERTVSAGDVVHVR